MVFFEQQGLCYYQFELFKDQPIFHAVLTRHGGFSKAPFNSLNTGGTVGDDHQTVVKNHERIYHVFGYDYFSRYDVWQVHGTKVLCAEAPRAPNDLHEKADGILTDNPNLTLFMRFADCVPILLFDPDNKVIGIIHAGWQGTFKKIAQEAVEKMAICYGSKPSNILAGIGPSICQNCYEVGLEVYQSFLTSFGKEGKQFFVHLNGNLHLDLWKANHVVLQNAGVTHIESSELCTACHLEDWYSHRAEFGKTGRFGVLMSLKG